MQDVNKQKYSEEIVAKNFYSMYSELKQIICGRQHKGLRRCVAVIKKFVLSIAHPTDFNIKETSVATLSLSAKTFKV